MFPEDMMQAAREAAKHGPEMWVSLSNGQYCTKEISKDELLQVALYAIATERARKTWQPIETAPSMQTVLIYFESSFGKGRTIRAVYAPEKTWEDSSYDGDFSQYDEKNDAYYYPSGWYEDLYNAVDDVGFHYLGADFSPTHWMPLPQPPKGEEK